MKKLLKNALLTMLLAMLVSAGVCAVDVSAAEGDLTAVSCTKYVVNPLYEDVVSVEDLKADLKVAEKEDRSSAKAGISSAASSTGLTNHNDMAKVIREGMKKHQATVTYTVFEPDLSAVDSDGNITKQWFNEHTDPIFDIAVGHTGVPDEGDYLRWQYGGYQVTCGGSGDSSGWTFTVSFHITYYVTAAEEAQVSGKVAAILSGLNLAEDASAYEKIQAVYDYLCATVTYDDAHVNDTSYKKQFTAYGALIDRICVCQGYAVAFYRLALELGVDNRVITGKSHGENHAWNIARMGARYYNLDSTWDAGVVPASYEYFLKTNAAFPDHTRNTEYTTSAFNSGYPMATAAYVPCGSTHAASGTWYSVKPDCTKEGVQVTGCSNCGKVISTVAVPKTGHTEHTDKQPATPSANGKITKTCSVCGISLASPQTIYKASKISISKGSYTFDGKVKTPALSVRDSSGKTIASTNYTVKKSTGRKSVGLYTYTVTFKGDYSGTVKKTFKINPKGTTIKAPSAAKKAFTAKWAKQSARMASSRITGYQVRYSLKSSMASSKTKTVKGYAKTKLTISGLKSGKKYYMQVRTYKTIGSSKYYSPWSAKKYVKVK